MTLKRYIYITLALLTLISLAAILTPCPRKPDPKTQVEP